MNEDNKIIMQDEEGEEIVLYALEEARFNGVYYLLATDSGSDDDEDGECYILKDVADPSSTESTYEFVTDDAELNCMFDIFSELMDDSDIEIKK